MLEAEVAKRVRLAVQKLGTTLFRNTVGMFMVVDQESGLQRFMRVGLCAGSSDYIGFTERTVRPEDVGRKVAVFTAIETKRSFGGKRAENQKTFVERVRLGGGIAGFANSAEDAVRLVESFTLPAVK